MHDDYYLLDERRRQVILSSASPRPTPLPRPGEGTARQMSLLSLSNGDAVIVDENSVGRPDQREEAWFDPYDQWLGIPAQEQPPNHYRLLGVSLFEAVLLVIDAS